MPRMVTLRSVPTEAERLHRRRAARAPRLVMLTLLLALAGCAEDPSASYIGGFGDPVRGAALYAPRNLGDTSRWAGQPAEAAVAAEQLEFLANELATNPRYAPEVNPAVLQSLQTARTEMRGYLGIALNADPGVVIAALRRAGEALREGSRARAEAALATAAFTAGPGGTLQRLSTMPRLPRTAEAAGMVASEFDRLERRR
jgi:hypothetical protein